MFFLSSRWVKYSLYFGALVTVGSVGFYIIGNEDWTVIDSIYMTIITLSTVGFSEAHPLSEVGKVWAILVIIFGASGFAVMISELGSELMELNNYRRRKMAKKISKMKNHYIICGFGRMGAVIAAELHNKKIPLVIVEINEVKINKIQDIGYMHIYGDATEDDTLIEAGIEVCEGIVVVLENDQDNLFVTMSSRNLNKDAYIISRCALHDTGKKLKRAGANKVVNPYITGGHRMAELLISPYVEDTVSLETPDDMAIDFSLEEFSVEHLQALNGKTIAETKLREDYGLLIVGISETNGDTEINPGSDKALSSGQKIIIIGSQENLTRFKGDIQK
ncbi:MAG: potassium channel protein [Candidatus Marinimicrobia bacterium]|nr:potassium channel protein [Candidatus Neomarinimicrobiota bacterium]MBL7010095.1 potassium channel protein [Candidatus Neomarinimicrobiota bacterium]MBL7029994.1 potassium channel protein [Candidatus Neomarinimicrobiota bacterium]